MTKVSIVGVEGSGKTVLMAVLGEQYKRPDANGLSLKPNNFETFTFVETAAADLRSGQWPAATTPEQLRQISWTLQRTTDKGVESLCELPMLDFAGEIYRLAFGDHTAEEIAPHREEVTALRNHVATSSCLVVLVNLSHVINGSMKDPRTLETIWLTQRIIEFANEHHVANVSVGLSQVDRYRAEIEACGGVSAAIDKYMPYIATSYRQLSVMELSAVGDVRPGTDGVALPRERFSSIGLERLVEDVANMAKGATFDEPIREDRTEAPDSRAAVNRIPTQIALNGRNGVHPGVERLKILSDYDTIGSRLVIVGWCIFFGLPAVLEVAFLIDCGYSRFNNAFRYLYCMAFPGAVMMLLMLLMAPTRLNLFVPQDVVLLRFWMRLNIIVALETVVHVACAYAFASVDDLLCCKFVDANLIGPWIVWSMLTAVPFSIRWFCLWLFRGEILTYSSLWRDIWPPVIFSNLFGLRRRPRA